MAEEFVNLTDEELAECVKENIPYAFAALSGRYLWLVRQTAARYVGHDAPEPDDLFQEGFLGLYAAALSYKTDGGASFKTYASACVHNRMTDAARRHSGAKNRVLNESLSLDTDDSARLARSDSPEELVELRENFREILRRADVELAPLERTALGLYLSGCKREDIEKISGMSLKTFDNAIYRVRRKLRQQ